MKYPNLLWLVAGLLLMAACTKKETTSVTPEIPTTPDTPVVSNIKATFNEVLLGPGELANTSNPIVTITGAAANDSFKYTITGVDTTIAGVRRLDENGDAKMYQDLFNYFSGFGEGQVTVKMVFKDTTLTVSGTKEAHSIRDYKDLLAIPNMGGIRAGETYTQVADVAFPDTVFAVSPLQIVSYGTYDGQGYKITNLNISRNTNREGGPVLAMGLFYSFGSGAVLKNVRLEYGTTGIMIGAGTTEGVEVGALVVYAPGATIQNCSVKVDINCAVGTAVEGGGLAYRITNGKVIASSYTGKVNNCMFGGLACSLSGQVDMSYAKFDYTGTRAAGVSVYKVNSGNDGTWYISNTYTYINTTLDAAGVYAFSRPDNNFNHYNSYSNFASDASGTTQYTTVADMNTALEALTVVSWPAGETVAAGNKPYVANGDDLAKLWWE